MSLQIEYLVLGEGLNFVQWLLSSLGEGLSCYQ